MRSRTLVINPPRGAVARALWLFSIIALAAVMLLFGVLIVGVVIVLASVAWLIRRLSRKRRSSRSPPSAQHPHLIEGEFVVVAPKPRDVH